MMERPRAGGIKTEREGTETQKERVRDPEREGQGPSPREVDRDLVRAMARESETGGQRLRDKGD